jgi:hypothetical protein
MSNLLRIILIHGHLPGVVELDLQGHSNICGTNASGKTTLQRLIPVFYGESPNKVVPKTRKKFDQFYLPHSNSYLVYEYQRENGVVCMVVLTRKSDEGVDYRFVLSAYAPELFLRETEQGALALSYSEFASLLRQQAIEHSTKIDSISHFRSIIQNDFSNLTLSRQDTGRLRQFALQYSLAEHPNRLRHIEKLVSAVHAKEGKMDTLKTMLAAIFEEEGVSLPVTQIKSNQVRDWVQKVRQSKRLDALQNQFQKLQAQANQLNHSENTLSQLYPLLITDEATLKTQIADNEASANHHKQVLVEQEEQFTQERRELQGQISQRQNDLTDTEKRLEQIEQQYQDYLDQDMPALEQALEQLPAWREECEQLEQRKKAFDDAISDVKQAFDAKLLALSERLRESEQQIRQKIEQTRQQKDAENNQQQQKRLELEQQHRAQLDLEREQFTTAQQTLLTRQTQIDERLNHNLLSLEEQQTLQLAQAHIDDLQEQVDSQNETVENLQHAHTTQKKKQDSHLDKLKEQQKLRYQKEQDYLQLKQQAEPKQGSLRAFLQENIADWQHHIGKTIQQDLLNRSDLSPQFNPASPSELFGLKLDLTAVEIPAFAQDDAQLKQALERANSQLNEQIALEQQLEALQKELNSATEQTEQTLNNAKQKRSTLRADLQFAKQSREQQEQQFNQLKTQRKSELNTEKQQIAQELQKLRQQQIEQQAAIEDEFKQFMLENTILWQENLQKFDHKIEQYQHDIKRKNQEFTEQEQEIELLKNQELLAKGFEPKQLEAIKQQLRQRQRDIQQTEARRDELTQYRAFMQLEWQQLKPEFLEKERQLKQQLRQLNSQLEVLKKAFDETHHSHKQQLEALKKQIQQQKQLLEQITPIVKSIESLALRTHNDVVVENIPQQAELRLAKAQQTLQQQNKLSQDLRSAVQSFENDLNKDSDADFTQPLSHFNHETRPQQKLDAFAHILRLLADRQQGLIDEGRNFGKDLSNFFTVFRDLNNRIQTQSRRLSDEVSDEFVLEGINKSEVKIQSTIDELSFWKELKDFAKLHAQWDSSVSELPDEHYLNSLSNVAELLRSEQQFSFESLLRIELHLNEGGSDLVIRNDRQLLESSSHGMAYLILCKYLLAFTRLLRGNANVTIHWPIDEIGTLAYHNVEKLFHACDNNRIYIVGAFPNPESDVLTLFKQRYLIEKNAAGISQLKRIEPKLSRLSQRLQAIQEQAL